MPSCENSSKGSSCSCNSVRTRTLFNANKNFTDKQYCGSNKLHETIKNKTNLSELACRFECLIDRVKQLELMHLVEPIISAANKLRLLEEYTEKIACKCDYDDYVRSNKNIPKTPQSIQCKSKPSLTDSSSTDSCGCRDSRGVKSCRCGSEPTILKPKNTSSQNKNVTNKKSDSPRRSESPRKSNSPPNNTKCDPCVCTVDPATGKRAKSQACKEAAKARRQSRRDTEIEQSCNDKQECLLNRDNKQASGDMVCLDELTVTGGFNLGSIGAQVTFSTLKIKDADEDDPTCSFKAEKNQAILCNLSSEEYDSTCSCDETCCMPYMKGCGKGDFNDFGGIGGMARTVSESVRSQGDSCGCGRCLADDEDDDAMAEICSCGCGDLIDLPRKKRVPRPRCRCVGCGKELTDNCTTPRTRLCGAGEKREPIYSLSLQRKQRRRTGKSPGIDEPQPRYTGDKRSRGQSSTKSNVNANVDADF